MDRHGRRHAHLSIVLSPAQVAGEAGVIPSRVSCLECHDVVGRGP